MKIALSGKGGVGKSTIAAALALTLSKRGEKVLAVDADPDSNLAQALGMPRDLREKIVPISNQIDLIEERTGTKLKGYGGVFKLNPEVADVSQRFATCYKGIDLLVLGAIQKGGGGCACPESSFIKALVTDLVLFKNETLIMDMEAGIEHLGRGTAHAVDVMLVIVEPGRRSLDCAEAVIRMASDIGIKKLLFVANKVSSKEDELFISSAISSVIPKTSYDSDIVYIPYSDAIRAADRDGVGVLDMPCNELQQGIDSILHAIDTIHS